MKPNRGASTALLLGLLPLSLPAASAKGVMTIGLVKPVYVDGKVLGPGKCQIAWVSHSPETDVSFAMHGTTVVETHGKMVERDTKSEYDGTIVQKNSDGQEILKEIHFAGKKTVLVLD